MWQSFYQINNVAIQFSLFFSIVKIVTFCCNTYIHRNKTLVWKTPCNQIPFRLSSGAEHRRIFRLANTFYSVCEDYQNATFFLKITQPSHQVHFVAAIYWKSIHLVLGNVLGDFQRCEKNGSCSHETNVTKLKNQWNLVLKLRKVTQHSIYITHVNRSTMHYRKSFTF